MTEDEKRAVRAVGEMLGYMIEYLRSHEFANNPGVVTAATVAAYVAVCKRFDIPLEKAAETLCAFWGGVELHNVDVASPIAGNVAKEGVGTQVVISARDDESEVN